MQALKPVYTADDMPENFFRTGDLQAGLGRARDLRTRRLHPPAIGHATGQLCPQDG
jgi:hypothetical protein